MGSWEILNNPSILIGILHTDATTVAWSVGLRNLKVPNGAILPVAGMPYDHARNTICQKALEAGVDYVAFLDSDVIPPPDAYIRLMAHRLPIVSGVYHRRSHPVGVPVMIKNGTWYAGYPKNSLIEVDLVGAGLMVIHRSVLTSIPPLDPDLGRNWFSWRVDRGHKLPPGEGLSEDFAYNLHCRRHGYKIIVDTSIISKHVGCMEVTENNISPLETPMCN